MALDAANYSLAFVPRPGQGAILDLYQLTSSVAASTSSSARPNSSTQQSLYPSTPQYTYERARTVAYAAELRDAHTSAVLSKFSTPTASLSEKQRSIQLCSPDEDVSVDRNPGVFNTEWKWVWQGVCRYRPATKNRSGQVEIYDYNLTRLEVHDRKGLEILLLSLILSLLDAEADENEPRAPGAPFNPPEGAVDSGRAQRPEAEVLLPSGLPPAQRTEYLPPAGARPPGAPLENLSQPPRNQQTANISRPPAVDLGYGRGPSGAGGSTSLAVGPTQESNEIDVGPFGDTQSYVAHALHLLRTDHGGSACDLVVLKARSVDTTPRAVQIAAEVKAAWYRLSPSTKGSSSSGELYQYVRDGKMDSQSPHQSGSNPSSPGKPSRPRIPLNEPIKGASSATAVQLQSYAPPEKLIVYLSKERIDEFERPGGAAVGFASASGPAPPSSSQAPYIPPKTGRPASSWAASSQAGTSHAHAPSASSSSPSPGANGKDENKRVSMGVGKLFGKLGRLKGSEH